MPRGERERERPPDNGARERSRSRDRGRGDRDREKKPANASKDGKEASKTTARDAGKDQKGKDAKKEPAKVGKKEEQRKEASKEGSKDARQEAAAAALAAKSDKASKRKSGSEGATRKSQEAEKKPTQKVAKAGASKDSQKEAYRDADGERQDAKSVARKTPKEGKEGKEATRASKEDKGPKPEPVKEDRKAGVDEVSLGEDVDVDLGISLLDEDEKQKVTSESSKAEARREQPEAEEASKGRAPRSGQEAERSRSKRREAPKPKRTGPCAARGLDSPCGSSASSSCESSSGSASTSQSGSRKRKRRGGVRAAAASGFSSHLDVCPPPGPAPDVSGPAGPDGQGPMLTGDTLAILPEKLRGILDSSQSIAQEVMALKQSLGACGPSLKDEAKEEEKETVLRRNQRLQESLLHPDNEQKFLARTGLAAAAVNEDGMVVLRAHSKKGLMKALSQLRRITYHCQWGCNQAKVSALLVEKAKPVNTMIVRLAATSSRLQSHEVRLTHKVRKLRLGTQASDCQVCIEGIPGLSRKHCTITFEPEKGACYVQDLSTNGTYLNGKRLPRPPYKNPQDARVRVFHGDELFFRLRSDDAEELGFVLNLVELG